MNVRTRVFNRIVTLIFVATAATAGFAASHLWDAAHDSSPARVTVAAGSSETVTQAFNDGWLTGEQNIQDLLGHRLPDAQEQNELLHAQKINGKAAGCHLEWDAPVRDQYEAICSVHNENLPAECLKVPTADQDACLKLDYRNATMRTNADGSITETPAGQALISECVSQYKGVELTSCLNQPAS